jgi:hypothetical protein
MAEYDPEGDEGGGELHKEGGGQQAVPFSAPACHVITGVCSSGVGCKSLYNVYTPGAEFLVTLCTYVHLT